MFLMIKNTIKNYLKKKTIIFYMIFPIVMMELVAGLLSNMFQYDSNALLGDKVINYVDNGTELSKNLFNELQVILEEMGATFNKIDDVTSGKKEVEKDRDILIVIDGEKIEVYGNSEDKEETAAIISIFNEVNIKGNVIGRLFEKDPVKGQEYIEKYIELDDIKVTQVERDKIPSSSDYYGIGQLVFFIIIVGVIPFEMVDYDRKRNIIERIRVAGINPWKYYSGMVIGTIILASISLLPGYLYSIFVMDVNWGNNLVVPFLLFIIFLCVIITLSMLISILVKDAEKTGNLFSGICIPLFGMLGGCFQPFFGEMSKGFNILTHISPLRWLLGGMMDYIYEGNQDRLIYGSILAVIISILLFVIGIIKVEREAKRI